MSRGRPFQPGNTFGQGRPKGSPNKKTTEAQKLFEHHSAGIMARAIHACLEDRQMLRMMARDIVRHQKGKPVRIGSLPMATVGDLQRASEVTLRKAATGKISLSDARDLSALIENRRRVLETQDLERRLSALEAEASLTSHRSGIDTTK